MLTLQGRVFNTWLVTSFSLVVHRLVKFVPPRQKKKNERSSRFFSSLTFIVSALLSAPVDAR